LFLDATFSHVTDDRLRQTTTDRRTQYCSISATAKNFSRQCETALSRLLRYVTLRYVLQRCHLLLNFPCRWHCSSMKLQSPDCRAAIVTVCVTLIHLGFCAVV